MRLSEPELYRLSRDTRVIARIALVVTAISTAIAYFLSETGDPIEKLFKLADIQESHPDIGDGVSGSVREVQLMRQTLVKLRALQHEYDWQGFQTQVINQQITNEQLRPLVLAYSQAALITPQHKVSWQALKTEAESNPPTRFANAFLGDLYTWNGDHQSAFKHYEIEAGFPDANYARQQILHHHIKAKDRDALVKLIDDPKYALSNDQDILELGVLLRDPALILRGVILHDYSVIPLALWPLTALVIFLWFWILKKICSIPRWRSWTMLYATIGVILGILSTTATLFAVVWQKNIWGLEFNGDVTNDFIVCIFGIGMREETIKLLFLLPLIPWLYRSKDPKTILITASCVGLGFAAQENLGYIQGHGTVARFVSANFFHIALTGALGFAFCRFLYTPRKEWERFLATYIAVIVIHGTYDFLLTHFGDDGAFLAIFVFICTAYLFLDLTEKHCPPARETISPLSVFVIGCSIIFGCSIIGAALYFPDFHSMSSLSGQQLISVAPLLFLYIHRFRRA